MTNPDQDIIDMITKATPDSPVNDDHRDQLRRQVLDAYDQRDAEADNEPARNPLFTFKGGTVMKLAASFALLAAIGILALTALTPSKAIAFEDVAREILKIDNASFEIETTIQYADGTTQDEGTYECVTKLPALMRSKMPDGDTVIIDFANDKMLIIDPNKKAAMLMEGIFEFSEDDDVQKNLFAEVQEHLRNAEQGGDFGQIKYETLGEKVVNGTEAIGFRVLNPDAGEEDFEAKNLSFNILDIWADAKTGGPVRLEFTLELEDGSQLKSTFKNFTYNQDLDPKLFAFEAPEGYELLKANELADMMRIGKIYDEEGEVGEEAKALADEVEVDVEDIVRKLQKRNQRSTSDDVVKALRGYTEQTGGKLPDTLESGPMIDAMVEAWEQANPGKPLFKEGDEVAFADEQMEQNYDTILQAAIYLGNLKGSGGNYIYRGKGVSVDDERKPVLWMQAKGAPAYRVVYNDLTTVDTNRGPDAE